jgi:hypothetical protein
MRLLILLFALVFTNQMHAKIRLLTFHYNLPELIEIQYKTLKQFIKEDYELIVFNDASDPNHEQAIKDVCDKYGIQCIRFKPEWHLTDPFNAKIEEWANHSDLYSHIGLINPQHPSVRHCHVIQYALDLFGYNHNDLVALLDGDCFPSKRISLRKLLGDKDIVGIRKEEGGVEYLWVVFVLFNPQTIPHKEDLKFHIDVINNQIHDTGSHTYHYLEDHPEIIYQKFHGEASSGFYHWNDQELTQYGFNSNEITLIRNLASLKDFPWPITVEFHVRNHFIHLGNSSFGLPGYREKIDCVKKFVKKSVKPHSLF